MFGSFGFGKRGRQYGQPPEWFSVNEALRMTDVDWFNYNAALAQSVVEAFSQAQRKYFCDLAEAVYHGLIGGPNDGQGRY